MMHSLLVSCEGWGKTETSQPSAVGKSGAAECLPIGRYRGLADETFDACLDGDDRIFGAEFIGGVGIRSPVIMPGAIFAAIAKTIAVAGCQRDGGI